MPSNQNPYPSKVPVKQYSDSELDLSRYTIDLINQNKIDAFLERKERITFKLMGIFLVAFLSAMIAVSTKCRLVFTFCSISATIFLIVSFLYFIRPYPRLICPCKSHVMKKKWIRKHHDKELFFICDECFTYVSTHYTSKMSS
jgi:hypothetical protein